MIDAASTGSTVRLGHLLAPAGVRYIAFVGRAAPTSGTFGNDEMKLTDALARQLDLTLSRVDDAGLVYDNDAWIPMHALVPPGDGRADRRPRSADGGGPVGARRRGRRSTPRPARPAVGTGDVVVVGGGELALGRDRERPEGRPPRCVRLDERVRARRARARARALLGEQLSPRSARVVEVVIWIVVVGVWFATRRRRTESRAAPSPRSRRDVAAVRLRDRCSARWWSARWPPAGVERRRRRPTRTPHRWPRPSSQSSTVWFCPGLPPALPHRPARVTFANVGGAEADVVVTDLADKGSATQVTFQVPADTVVTKTRDQLGRPAR